MQRKKEGEDKNRGTNYQSFDERNAKVVKGTNPSANSLHIPVPSGGAKGLESTETINKKGKTSQQ